MKKRLARYVVFALVLLILLVAPALVARASMLYAQAAGVGSSSGGGSGDGVSVGTLIAIVSALLTAYGGTVLGLVKHIHDMSKSKDEMSKEYTAGKAAQVAAHRADIAERDQKEREERRVLMEALERERDRNERQGEARARDAMEATRVVAEVSTTAMRVVDGLQGDSTFSTPNAADAPSPVPAQRDSRTSMNPVPVNPLQEGLGPNTQKGGRAGAKRNSHHG